MAKKEKPIVLDALTREEKMKYEIAEELGLLEKVKAAYPEYDIQINVLHDFTE